MISFYMVIPSFYSLKIPPAEFNKHSQTENLEQQEREKKNYIYIYLPNPSIWAGYDTGSIFLKCSLTGLNFPSPRLVASSRPKNQSALLFTHSWRENNWIHTFPKGLSAMWNAISLVQDLNSCCRVHFLRR